MLTKFSFSDNFILNHYVNVAEVLGEMFAPFLEVVVHDLRNPDEAIIAIYNGHITGRKVGDSTTDLGHKRLKEKVPDKILNYSNEGLRGIKLRSSSLGIRNQKNELIGSICLNLNISVFEDIGSILQNLISTAQNPFINGKEKFLTNSPSNDIKEAISQIIINQSMNSTKLSKKDKIDIIQALMFQNQFNIKGAVTLIAKELKLSKPTVYKYRKITNKPNL